MTILWISLITLIFPRKHAKKGISKTISHLNLSLNGHKVSIQRPNINGSVFTPPPHVDHKYLDTAGYEDLVHESGRWSEDNEGIDISRPSPC